MSSLDLQSKLEYLPVNDNENMKTQYKVKIALYENIQSNFNTLKEKHYLKYLVKSNQYVKKSAIIGELISTEKQTLTEKKPILSSTAGEIFIPRLKTRTNLITQNRLLWILSGQVSVV